MKKRAPLLSRFLPTALLISFFAYYTPPSLAQGTPTTPGGFAPPTVLPGDNTDLGGYGDACIGLANAIRQGELTLRQTPCFLKYFSKTLIAVAGTLAVIFIMVGGYRYVLGADEAKDEAKRTVTYALIGLAVTLLAWVIVDIALQLVTE